MAFNSVAFKKSMLTWDAASKKAPTDVLQVGKKMSGNDPEAMKLINAWSKQISTQNQNLRNLLDKVVTAKDEKARADAAKNASNSVKQYQNFVTTTPLPAEVQTPLKNALTELAKGLS